MYNKKYNKRDLKCKEQGSEYYMSITWIIILCMKSAKKGKTIWLLGTITTLLKIAPSCTVKAYRKFSREVFEIPSPLYIYSCRFTMCSCVSYNFSIGSFPLIEVVTCSVRLHQVPAWDGGLLLLGRASRCTVSQWASLRSQQNPEKTRNHLYTLATFTALLPSKSLSKNIYACIKTAWRDFI